MRRTSILCAIVVIVASLGGRTWMAAQDVSPAAGPPSGLIVPDPSECTVEPRPLSFFEQIAATPPALPPNADQRFSKPGQDPRPWTLPAGEPADPATVEAITATLREALACLNANDTLRFLALFSDDVVRIFFALDPLPPEALPFLAASPVASPPEQRLGYRSVHDVRVLPDGRVAGLGENYDPTEPPFGMGTDFAIFVKVGDRWLIDSLIENVAIVGVPSPTT
jgi:hypothetical protein